MSENKQREKLKAMVKEAPKSYGVYFWENKKGEILYVGRAINLKARLSQYLQNNIDVRIAEMVNLATNVRYEKTDSLLEAIVLEAKYIKEYWPKYNIKDKDNRSFIYIVFPKKKYSSPILVRGHDLKKFPAGKADVFGPYQSYYLLRKALKLIRRVFPYGNCRANNGKPCFDYQIGLCPGSCIGKISSEDYSKNIKSIKMILKGEKKRLIKDLEKNNPEKATALKQLQEVSLLSREEDLSKIEISRLEGYDISHHAGKESYGAMSVMENGFEAKDQYRLFKIKDAPVGDDERALWEVLSRRFKHKEWVYPNLIMIDGGTAQISFLNKKLLENNINVPIVGISKYGDDRLVFPSKAKKEHRLLAENIKSDLLKLREEAHRFANRGRRSATKIVKKK
jgi:excinuclease ABC subunit C